MDKKSTLKIGLVLGAVVGAVTTYFLSPRTGKENREMAAAKWKELQKMLKDKNIDEIVQEIYGKASAEGKKVYMRARDDISEKLADMKGSLEDIDKGKYVALVDDVLNRLQTEKDVAQDHVDKLRTYFMERWGMAQDMAQDDADKVAQKAKKTATKKSN